uniref:Rho GTPase-activating protein 29 n=1 Tax=Erpetoichthys calabaricus TaxID=27687 RepID=A0A8C4SQR6_ERPCA
MLRQNSSGNKRTLGIPRLSSSNFFPQSVGTGNWVMGRGTKSNSVSSISSNSDCLENPVVDPEYIMQLVNDVRKFADVLLRLKDAFHSEETQDCLHQVVHERLGELLRVLRTVISKHQTLNSVDILSAAGTVIAKVKGVNYKEVNEDNKLGLYGEIFSSIDTLAFTFGNVVSDFLMGDVDSGSALGIPQTRRSRSFSMLKDCFLTFKFFSSGHLRAEELDNMLLKNDSGIESALLYAKAWSKYTKDILAWVEKRLSLDMECAKTFAKMAESVKTLIMQQEHMPFREIYISAFENDIESSQILLQTAAALQTNKFMQPLLARRNELDKLRKELKEQWQREQKKMQEADLALKKARLLYTQRHEEYERAKSSTIRMEEEQLSSSIGATKDSSKQLEKRRRIEEESQQRAAEASDQYKACIADLRELVFQCDLTLKVTVNLFQMQQAQVVSLPVNYQTLCESAKLYEPGECYSEFAKSLPKEEEQECIESSSNTGGLTFGKRTENSAHSSHGNLSQMSVTSADFQAVDDVESPVHLRKEKMGNKRSCSSTDIQGRTQGPLQVWPVNSQGGGMCSDSESAGGSSESRSMDSPSASPGDFKRRLPRTPSTGTMSSADDLDEREPPSPSDNDLNEIPSEMTSSPGPFRNALMSKAAQTHKLRKLRAPSKCRECDSLVVFHGAECEECSLACHKKCLETLAIQCGHKKLHGRLHLFGIDFTQAAKNNPDGIPFIIKKCTSEIENRALNIKGIYRVNGAKSRVEKLCQAFENGKDLVELSDLYPHDISNVLKLYLRQLPEPLILFRLYNELIGLAKESQQVMIDEVDGQNPGSEKPAVSIQLNRIIFKIRDLLKQLPPAHYNTLRYLISHLHRVADKEEENKMSPRQTDADVSLSSLVDYPYQARIVELLITHFDKMFDVSLKPLPSSPPAGESSPLQLKSPIMRLSAQDKEQHLKRHSKSLVDIKEQTSKVYKRHSSIIPSSHLIDEMKDVRHTVDRSDSSNEWSVSGVFILSINSDSDNSIAKVQMRPLRSKLVHRPISMPIERLLNPSQMNEKNSRNLSQSERSPTIEENVETTKVVSVANIYCRKSYYDTQTFKKPSVKPYRHYITTHRTAMIMANVPQDLQPEEVPSTIGSNSSALQPRKPYTIAVRPIRTANREDISSELNLVSSALRAPRTLQPPPGTFYKPPTNNPVKEPVEQVPDIPDATVNCSEDKPIVGEPLQTDCGTMSDISPAQPSSPNSSPEEFSQSEAKPVYQRLRSKRVQEFEHREAHFV